MVHNHKELAVKFAEMFTACKDENNAGIIVGKFVMATGQDLRAAQIVMAEIDEEGLMPPEDIAGLSCVMGLVLPGFSVPEGRYDLYSMKIENQEMLFDIPEVLFELA